MADVCADCGKTVEKVRNIPGWGHRVGQGHDFCCRVVDHPTKAGKIVSADYHYVEGETQRHFRAVDDG
jgi:hypothetical protein